MWQALTAQSQGPPQPPGTLTPEVLGYYTQATNVLHLDLLPTAERLRDASEDRLDRAYADKRATETWGLGLAVVLGAALTVLLVAVLDTQARRLGSARDDSLLPYLALSQARAISYDAAADTSRYVISANRAHYRQDFVRKSGCLTGGGPCGTGGDTIDGGLAALAAGAGLAPQGRLVLDRWLVYQRDHEQILGYADSGRTAEAIDALTGIRRGDAAFDFIYFDAAVGDLPRPADRPSTRRCGTPSG